MFQRLAKSVRFYRIEIQRATKPILSLLPLFLLLLLFFIPIVGPIIFIFAVIGYTFGYGFFKYRIILRKAKKIQEELEKVNQEWKDKKVKWSVGEYGIYLRLDLNYKEGVEEKPSKGPEKKLGGGRSNSFQNPFVSPVYSNRNNWGWTGSQGLTPMPPTAWVPAPMMRQDAGGGPQATQQGGVAPQQLAQRDHNLPQPAGGGHQQLAQRDLNLAPPPGQLITPYMPPSSRRNLNDNYPTPPQVG